MINIQGGRLYQWDIDREVIITPRTEINEVHFAHPNDAEALVLKANILENAIYSANIPNILLQSSENIVIYAVNNNVTVEKCTVNVIDREKPADYVYTETEVKRWEDLEQKVIDGIGYYKPIVDDNGNLSWQASNEKFPTIEPINIKGPISEITSLILSNKTPLGIYVLKANSPIYYVLQYNDDGTEIVDLTNRKVTSDTLINVSKIDNPTFANRLGIRVVLLSEATKFDGVVPGEGTLGYIDYWKEHRVGYPATGTITYYNYATTENVSEALEELRNTFEKMTEGALITRYGVRFGGSSNSGSTVQRLYNAVGLVAGVGTDTNTVENNFDNIYPWSDIRRCCGYWSDDGHFVVNAYKGEPGYTVDGSNGEVWVEIPLFYYKHTYTEGAEEIVISAFKLPGFMPSPINRDQGTEDAPAAKAYYPAYPMALVDDKPTSRSGVFNDIYSLNTAMMDARKAGEKYTVSTTAERYTVCLLMWVEFATRNMQRIMQGAVNMPYSANEKATVAETGANRIIVSAATAAKFVVGQTIGIGTSYGSTGIANNRIITAIEDYDNSNKAICFDGDPVNVEVGNAVFTLAWKNGSCDNVIASSGSPVSNTSGKYNCMYRGIEKPYGDSFEWISDILLKKDGAGTAENPYTYNVYFLPNPTKYANGAITNDYVKLNYGIPGVDGFVKTLGLDSRYPWIRIPDAIGASATAYYSDYYYYPRSATCAARVGGDWNSGNGAGPHYLNCSNVPSRSDIRYRARLSYHR